MEEDKLPGPIGEFIRSAVMNQVNTPDPFARQLGRGVVTAGRDIVQGLGKFSPDYTPDVQARWDAEAKLRPQPTGVERGGEFATHLALSALPVGTGSQVLVNALRALPRALQAGRLAPPLGT